MFLLTRTTWGLLEHIKFLGLTHQLQIAASCPIHKSEAGTLLQEDGRTVSDFCELEGAPFMCWGCSDEHRISAVMGFTSMSSAWLCLSRGEGFPALSRDRDTGWSTCSGGEEGRGSPSAACASPGSARRRFLCLPALPGRRKCIESIVAEIFTET